MDKEHLPVRQKKCLTLRDKQNKKLMTHQLITRRTALSRVCGVGLVSLTSSLIACGGAGGTMTPMTADERKAQVKSQIDTILAGDWSAGKPGLSV